MWDVWQIPVRGGPAVNLTVNANNTNPVAVNDSFATNQGIVVATQYDRTLLVNDTDVDLGGGNVGMKAVLVTGPPAAQGTLALRQDGTFTFTPNASYQASTLRSGASARMNPGECGLVISCWRSAPSRIIDRHTCAKPMKKR